MITTVSTNQEAIQRKERRRSSLEQSNRNKNGVLEWTAWKRPSSDSSSLGVSSSSHHSTKGMDGPRPKRASVNLPQEWVSKTVFEEVTSRESATEVALKKKKKTPQVVEEEKKEDDNFTATPRISNPDDWEDIIPQAVEKEETKKNQSPTTTTTAVVVEKSWIAQNMYGIILAGVMTLTAYGMKIALDVQKEGDDETA